MHSSNAACECGYSFLGNAAHGSQQPVRFRTESGAASFRLCDMSVLFYLAGLRRLYILSNSKNTFGL